MGRLSGRGLQLLGVVFGVVLVASGAVAVAELITERSWAVALGFGRPMGRWIALRVAWWCVVWLTTWVLLWWFSRRVEKAGGMLLPGPLGTTTATVSGAAPGRLRGERRARLALNTALSLLIAPVLGDRIDAVVLAAFGWRERMPGVDLLGVDPGFLVFRLPLLLAITRWMTLLSVTALALTGLGFALRGQLSRGDRSTVGLRSLGLRASVARTLLWPFVWLCACAALELWWRRFQLATEPHGRFAGLFDVQRNVQIPLLTVLALGAITIAGSACVVTRPFSFSRTSTAMQDARVDPTLPLVGVSLWLVCALIGLATVPVLGSGVTAKPGPTSRGDLARHTAAMLSGYSLDSAILTPSAQVANSPTPDALQRASDASAAAWSSATVDPNWAVPSDSAPAPIAVFRDEGPTKVRPRVVGISLDGLWPAFVASVRFGQFHLLSARGNGAVLVHHRSAAARVSALLPFARVDQQPDLISLQSQQLWLVRAYTWTNLATSAQRAPDLGGGHGSVLSGGLNYLRPSVLALVDAKTGSVTMYRTDLTDPIARTWARALPGLLRGPGQLERDFPGIENRLSFPSDLFSLQSFVLRTYHSLDITAIAASSDAWRPTSLRGGEPSDGPTTHASVGSTLTSLRTTVNVAGAAGQASTRLAVLTSSATRAPVAVLRGTSNAVGSDEVTLVAVAGAPSPDDARGALVSSVDVQDFVRAQRSSKRVVTNGVLVPALIPTSTLRPTTVQAANSATGGSDAAAARATVGLIYVQALGVRTSPDTVEQRATVMIGSAGVALGETVAEAWERYQLRLKSAASDRSLAEVRAELAATQLRLAEAEAELARLRGRASTPKPQATVPRTQPPVSSSP